MVFLMFWDILSLKLFESPFWPKFLDKLSLCLVPTRNACGVGASRTGMHGDLPRVSAGVALLSLLPRLGSTDSFGSVAVDVADPASPAAKDHQTAAVRSCHSRDCQQPRVLWLLRWRLGHGGALPRSPDSLADTSAHWSRSVWNATAEKMNHQLGDRKNS